MKNKLDIAIEKVVEQYGHMNSIHVKGIIRLLKRIRRK